MDAVQQDSGGVKVPAMEGFFNFKGASAHPDEANNAGKENSGSQKAQHKVERPFKAFHDGHEANNDACHHPSGAKNLNPGNLAEVIGQIVHHVLFSFDYFVMLSCSKNKPLFSDTQLLPEYGVLAH